MAFSRGPISRIPDRCRSYGAARALTCGGYKYFAPTGLVCKGGSEACFHIYNRLPL